MKTLKYFALASVFTLGLTSCGDFGDLNTDPEHLNEINVPYEMLFSNAQHQALGSDWDMWRTGCIYSAQWTQQLSSIGWWDSYGRYNYSDGYSASFWDTYSSDRGAMRDVTTCYDKWNGAAGMEVDWNMARVMRIYAFAKMTDLYGDIPYSEAGRPRQYSYPKYDSQEEIYKSMLAELDEAQANLTGAAKMGSQDLYYQGNASQWKKFANSLMLRLAMRLVKIDPTTAKNYAAKAVANGVMESNADNCILKHSDGVTTNDSAEPFAKIMAHEDREFYLSDVFVNMLKNTNDPRLSAIGTICGTRYGSNGVPERSDQVTDIQQTGGWSENNSAYKDVYGDYGNMAMDAQNGMPVGGYSSSPTSKYTVSAVDPWMAKNDANIFYIYVKEDGKKDTIYNYEVYYNHYSTVNRYTYADQKAPTFVLTYAQTKLLMAEAAQRGYISGNAKTYYEDGVKAAFAQFEQFPNAAGATKVAFPEGATAAANAYLAANPYNEAKALEQINTQYYINTFGDPHEVFANWRRSGFPVLTPAPMAALDGSCATDGSIPRRFRYPSTESQVNKTNYDAAVARQGGDTFSTRVWWDKEN